MKMDKKTYEEIEAMIQSDASPVGIDAKKTHIWIIHKLNRIEERLAGLEKRLAGGQANGSDPSDSSDRSD